MAKKGGKQPIFFDGIYAKTETSGTDPEVSLEAPKKSRKIAKFAEISHANVKETVKKEKKAVHKKVVKTKKAKLIHNLKVAMIAIGTIIFLNLTVISGIVFGYPSMYKDKVFPGVNILGQEMGGRYNPELRKLVREKLDNNKIYFKIGDKEEATSLYDLGVKIDSNVVADSAYRMGRSGKLFDDAIFRVNSFAYWVSPEYHEKIFSPVVTEIPYKVDNNTVSEYSKKIFEKYKTPEKNASIIIKGTDVEVLPAEFGEKIVTDSLEKQINIALADLKNGDKVVVSLNKEKITPGIKEEGLTKTVAQTREITGKTVVLKFEDKKYSLNKETLASWVVFEQAENTFTPRIDQGKVEGYLNGIAKDINVAAEPRKIRIENSVKETVAEEGKEGRVLLVKDTAGQVKTFLEEDKKVGALNILTAKVAPKVIKEEVLVANWDKYIDINLSSQTTTAYLKDGVQVASWKVTTGKTSTPTPVGTWLVHGKSAVVRMTGGTRGVDYYDLPNVHWVTWFKGGGYAFHEAYWRTVFGGQDYKWAGSHGCVNMPIEAAKFIYDWAPVGTPVIVHY